MWFVASRTGILSIFWCIERCFLLVVNHESILSSLSLLLLRDRNPTFVYGRHFAQFGKWIFWCPRIDDVHNIWCEWLDVGIQINFKSNISRLLSYKAGFILKTNKQKHTIDEKAWKACLCIYLHTWICLWSEVSASVNLGGSFCFSWKAKQLRTAQISSLLRHLKNPSISNSVSTSSSPLKKKRMNEWVKNNVRTTL